VIHACCDVLLVELVAQKKRRSRLSESSQSQRHVKARSAVLNIKKRHVESMTRLPTKRMATACWDFIVFKRGPLQTAPLLDFSSLHDTNKKFGSQDIHKGLWSRWG